MRQSGAGSTASSSTRKKLTQLCRGKRIRTDAEEIEDNVQTLADGNALLIHEAEGSLCSVLLGNKPEVVVEVVVAEKRGREGLCDIQEQDCQGSCSLNS